MRYLQVGKKLSFLFLFIFLCGQVFSKELSCFELAEKIGATVEWDTMRNIGCIVKNGKKVLFDIDSNFIVIDYNYKIGVDYIKFREGILVFGDDAVDLIDKQFNIISDNIVNIKGIIIDAGHGGRDSGAISVKQIAGKYLAEKDVVLDVALKLNAKLSNKFSDIPIILTRDKDIFLKLNERTEIANSIKVEKNDIILFISLHANASLNRDASGFEVWYLPQDVKRDVVPDDIKSRVDKDVLPIVKDLIDDEVSFESILLSKKVLEGMDKHIGKYSKSRGIKAEEWFVVKNAKMPAILVEVGFVTNYEEAKLLATESYLDKVVDGIFWGINEFVTIFSNADSWKELSVDKK